jgi:hypothetical protein
MTTTAPEPIDWADLPSDVPTAIEPDDDAHAPPPTVEPITPQGDARAQAERARVLRHPDIARRLCEPPLRFSRPEVWNGYLPSDMWQGRHNDSIRRAALVEIITAAVKADKEATYADPA